MGQPLPDWVLLRYRLGELPPERRSEVRALVEADPSLQERLRAMEAEEASLHQRLPPRAVASRARPAQRRRQALVFTPVAVLAAIFLVVLALPTDRAKGAEPFLRVHHQVPGGVEELHPGDTVEEGDVLQLHYAAMGQPWGMIWSEDGRGSLTVHLGDDQERSVPLTPEGSVALPTSYTLDDAPDFERFTLVTCPEPFELAGVDELSEGCTRYDFALRKP